jgi:hypothetical protein
LSDRVLEAGAVLADNISSDGFSVDEFLTLPLFVLRLVYWALFRQKYNAKIAIDKP